ncbi:MAG TPA: hypothetical protein VHC18_00980 [Amycolatopsis sp.]|nr:hypothetical protein [Amycolatopsis sp.]
MTTRTYEYQSDFARKYFGQGRIEGLDEGRVEGEATALLDVLAARDITITDNARTRIHDCSDPELLRTWIRRAVTATTVDELFD